MFGSWQGIGFLSFSRRKDKLWGVTSLLSDGDLRLSARE
jgi:hypothetical protein